MLKLYTDESPGLKVDPFVVMVLSIGFIISVVALHSKFTPGDCMKGWQRRRVLKIDQFWQRSPSASLRRPVLW